MKINAKPEILNTKQILPRNPKDFRDSILGISTKFQRANPKYQIPNNRFEKLKLRISDLFRVSSLGFRILFVLWIFISGCEQIDKESIDKVIQEDPSFKEVLMNKEDLDSKIELLLNQLRSLKAMTDTNIRTIQENFTKQRNEIDSKIAALKKELEPERFKIRQEMDTLRNSISTKRGMLKSLENTRRDLVKLINQQKAVDVTAGEMSRWQERLAALNRQIEPLIGEIREMEEKMKFLRIKLMALRQ